MTCLAVLLLAFIILFATTGIAIGLLSIAAGLLVIAVAVLLVFLLYFWRSIYPLLVRIGRWSAQVKNLVFLGLALAAIGIGIGYLIHVPTITIPLIGIQLPVTVLLLGLIFLPLLFLGAVVWVVRIWRRGWPLVRDFFWDLYFRAAALLWKIVVGIPLGVVWFFYHPPLRWLVAAFIFYLRGISAAAAWLVYNPPLKGIGIAIIFITKIAAVVVAAILYNPPILWLIQAGLFGLRLAARVVSSAIYAIWAWWPTKGVRSALRTGVITDSKSYQDYKYA
jgi:hypothetical protein